MRILRSYPLAMAGITLAAALTVPALSSTANAASTFLLQFGQHDTESAARQQWDALQKAHPDLLGDMNLRVAPVTNASGSEIYRTQASGVANREEAQNTCNALSAQNVTCMVVETSMYLPETQAAPLMQTELTSGEMDAVTLEAQPLLVQEQPVAQPKPEKRSSFFLPWMNSEEKETQAPAEEAAPAVPVTIAAAPTPPAPVQAAPRPERVEPVAQPKPIDRAAAAGMSANLAPGETRAVPSRAPRSLNEQVTAKSAPAAAPQTTAQPEMEPQVDVSPVNGAAEVEIAEAIQVPLSFDDIVAAPANRPVGYGGYPSQPQPKRALWIQLSHFASKEAAMNYWRMLSSQKPELMRLLRVRVISPFRDTYGHAKTSLRMGPFRDQAEINELCSTAAQQKLRCTSVQEVGNSATAPAGRQAVDPAAHYNRRQATARSYSRTPGAQPSGMFWVQLGAFDTVDAAQQRWNQLKTVHGDLLGRMQPQVSYPALSSSPQPVYHLRTGPFVTQTSAAQLCNSLSARHLGCIIVQAR